MDKAGQALFPTLLTSGMFAQPDAGPPMDQKFNSGVLRGILHPSGSIGPARNLGCALHLHLADGVDVNACGVRQGLSLHSY